MFLKPGFTRHLQISVLYFCHTPASSRPHLLHTMAAKFGTTNHSLPLSYKRKVTDWLEEDCPSFDYGGFVVGEEAKEARLLGKSPVGPFVCIGVHIAVKILFQRAGQRRRLYFQSTSCKLHCFSQYRRFSALTRSILGHASWCSLLRRGLPTITLHVRLHSSLRNLRPFRITLEPGPPSVFREQS